MGTSTSKATQKASQAATTTARKYPTRSPPLSSTSSKPTPNPTIKPSVPPQASSQDPPPAPPSTSETRDPALSARLRTLGPVTPQPTFSHSSTFSARAPLLNPANPPSTSRIQTSSPQSQQSSRDPSLSSSFIPSASSPQQSIFPQAQNAAVSLLTARYRLAEMAEKEFANVGKAAADGREFLDVVTIRRVLEMRESGMGGEEIERRLELKRGVVRRMGRRGVLGVGS